MPEIQGKGIRVSDVCRTFENNDPVVPHHLKLQVEYICNMASAGDPDFLEPEEIALANESSYLIDDYEGIEELAQTVKKMTYMMSDSLGAHKMLYNGFDATSVNEPPFVVAGVPIQKLTEKAADGAITLLVLGATEALLYPTQIVLKKSSEHRISGDLFILGNFFTSDIADRLPFSPNYEADVTLNAYNATFAEMLNNESFDEPVHALGDSKYLDGAGRLFCRSTGYTPFTLSCGVQASRYYLAPPDDKAYVTLGYENNLYTKLEWEEYLMKQDRGYGCFTGEMLLKTESGESITFKVLHEMYERGDDLPFLQVWDPDRKEWTYQQPASVKRHIVTPKQNLLRICHEFADDRNSCDLEVTPNHFLWMRRNGQEYWRPAEAIFKGDQLKSGNSWINVTGNFNSLKKDREELFSVYNLSFDQEKGDYANYAISGNGSEWFIAHNIKIY